MFKIHTRNGATLTLDLSDARQARDWLARLSSVEIQREITSVTIQQRHLGRFRCESCGEIGDVGAPVQYSLTRPDGMSAEFRLEHVAPSGKTRGSERLVLLAGETRVVLTAHARQASARVCVDKIAPPKQRYRPRQEDK